MLHFSASCRCPLGWEGHRCESPAPNGNAESGGRKSIFEFDS